MTNFSMSCARRLAPTLGVPVIRLASVTAMYAVKFEPRRRGPASALIAGSGLPPAASGMQLSLQPDTSGYRIAEPIRTVEPGTHTCSYGFRPNANLSYEHMFSSARPSTFGQRALGALRLTRSFLLLEDDYAVDWEVDRDEWLAANHPHRAPLRGRLPARRPGSPEPVPHVCLCPVGPASGLPDAPRVRPVDQQRLRRNERLA
jgi:hypothetical protein